VAKKTQVKPREDISEAAASTLATIGLRVRELRTLREMTLQDLADASGLSVSMLSLVERGRASPSIGSLMVIAGALSVTMSDLIAVEPTAEDRIVVRASEQSAVTTPEGVIRRLLREDRSRGVTIALNEYEPNTGSDQRMIAHGGFEYGFVLEGKLTVEVDGTPYVLGRGDLIAYHSRRPHRIWSHGPQKVRTLWFNLDI
jgi:transcriptional regulator with XRE-family HTH domain